MKKIKLEEQKNIVCSNKVILLDEPTTVYYLLENHTYLPMVKKGDYVYQEEQIAFRKKDHFPLFASISGIVESVDFEKITIHNDFKNRVRKHNLIEHVVSSYTKEQIPELLFQLGIMNTKENEKEPYQIFSSLSVCKTLIVSALQQEAYLYLESFLLKIERKQILELIEAFIDIYNFKEVLIVVPKHQELLIEEWQKCIKDYKIKIVELEEYYALSNYKALVKTVKKVVFQNDSTEKGIVVLNISTILAIYGALKYQRPQIKTFVQFTGNMWKNNCYMEVRIGTPLKEAIQKLDFKRAKEVLLLQGGIISGHIVSIQDWAIIAKTPVYTAWKVTTESRQESCIRCGKCIKVCPMHLHPVLIMDAVSKNRKLNQFHLKDCIECGLCSYICPSYIEVHEFVKKAKERIK